MSETPASFRPPALLADANVQSVLASLKLRRALIRMRGTDVERRARRCLLECGDGVRLEGLYSPTRDGANPRGLALLLHGWEGSTESTYLVSLAHRLDAAGYAVFRLNFRDHGDTHHLNEDLFHSCRLDEVVQATRRVADSYPVRPLFVVGFSLGGNFALRMALQAPDVGIPLTRIVAVSPVVDPRHGLEAMQRTPFYERHFMKKWRSSLARKQAAFPERYDFSEWMRLENLGLMTSYLINRDDEFESLDDYFDGYSIAGSRLARLGIPATVITAADDPIIPVADFRELELPDCVELDIQDRGGHCGFIENPAAPSWIDRRILAILDRASD
jgi:predicted alpha/beta-fold hydrolase